MIKLFDKDTEFIEKELEKLGYWKRKYSKPNAFGTGATKLALIAHKEMEKNNVKRILELGCGQGRDCIFFAQNGYFITATDFSTDAINFIKNEYESKYDNLETRVHDLNHEFLNYDKYDCVYSNLALQFFDENHLKNIFERIYSLLNLNGLFIFSTKKKGDKYYKAGEKINEDTYRVDGITRFFFEKDKLIDLLKDKFKIKTLGSEKHVNPDKTVSELWYFIGQKTQL